MTGAPKRNVGGRPKGSRTRPKRVPSPVLRVVGYARTEAGDEGPSLAEQEAEISAYCTARGHDLVAVHSDADHDGCDMSRSGLQTARHLLWTREADALLVTDVDRLGRSVLVVSFLLERDFGALGARLLCVHEDVDAHSAEGRFALHRGAIFSECQREGVTLGEIVSLLARRLAPRV